MIYEVDFLRGLLTTLSIEVPVLVLLMRFSYFSDHHKHGLAETIGTGIVATCLTLPYLWFVLPVFISNHFAYLIICESSAVLVESLIYYPFLGRRYWPALAASVICNMTSYLLGLLIF